MDKTGLKNAEPEIFSSAAEFLNSLLPLTSFHCIRNFIFWAGDVNIKDQYENRRKRLHLFCHAKQFYFCIWFLRLQSRIFNYSLTAQSKVQKVFSLDLSLAQKARNQRSLMLHASFLQALPHLGNSVTKRQVLNVPSQNRFFSAKTC